MDTIKHLFASTSQAWTGSVKGGVGVGGTYRPRLPHRVRCAGEQPSAPGCLAIVRFDDPYQAAVEFLGIGRVQKLIWPMGVGVRTEHAGDQKLGLRETLAQHR